MILSSRCSLLALLVGGAALLSGCDTIRQADANTKVALTEAEVNADRAREPLRSRPADSVLVTDEKWLGRTGFVAFNGDPLPPDTDNFTLVSAGPLSVAQVAAEVSGITGLPVSLELVSFGGGGEEAAAAGGADAGALPGGGADATLLGLTTLGGPAAPAPAAPQGEPGTPSEIIQEVNYSGSLRGFLDYVTSLIQADWVYDQGRIRIFNQRTQTFTILTQPGLLTVTSEISGSLGAEGQSGEDDGASTAAGASTGFEAELESDVLAEARDAVVQILGSDTQVTVSTTASSISATGPIFLMRKVEEYVNDLNRRLARQVTVDVKVLRVLLTNEDNYAIDLSAAISGEQLLNRDLSLNVGPLGLATAENLLFQGTLSDNNNTYSALVNALSTVGEVSIVQNASVTTLNGQTVPLNIIQQEEYIAEVSREEDEDGDVTISTERSTLATGFTMSLTPRVLGTGEVMIRYVVNLADGLVQDLFSDPDSGAQVRGALTDVQTVAQNMLVNSRETVVVAGFERQRSQTSRSGVGSPDNILPSGARNGNLEREFFVVLMTPRVQDFGKSYASTSQ